VIGFDLLIVGAVLGVGSALLFAKSNLNPSYPDETATAYLGSNPFQLRNTICQRSEAVAGAVWLALSLLCLSAGSILAAGTGQQRCYGSLWLHTTVIILAGLGGLWGTLAIANKLSRKTYLPRMIAVCREGFELCSIYVTHAGRSQVEVDRGILPELSTQQRRLAETTAFLDMIGKVIDVPRKTAEVDSQYMERLRSFFQAAR